jgi:hypothetical protein
MTRTSGNLREDLRKFMLMFVLILRVKFMLMFRLILRVIFTPVSLLG